MPKVSESVSYKIAKVIKEASDQSFGYVPPTDPLYLRISKFKMEVGKNLEKMALVWEAEIRREYEKKKYKIKKNIDGSINTDSWGNLKS